MTAGRDRDVVLAALADFPGRLAAAAVAANVAAAVAASRPVPAGEWGPAEVVRHLIACETDVHQARLADLATVASPMWDWAEPGPWHGEPELALQEVLARFTGLRATTLASVAALSEADWARTGTHRTFGQFDVQALLGNAIEHDEHHLQGLG